MLGVFFPVPLPHDTAVTTDRSLVASIKVFASLLVTGSCLATSCSCWHHCHHCGLIVTSSYKKEYCLLCSHCQQRWNIALWQQHLSLQIVVANHHCRSSSPTLLAMLQPSCCASCQRTWKCRWLGDNHCCRHHLQAQINVLSILNVVFDASVINVRLTTENDECHDRIVVAERSATQQL